MCFFFFFEVLSVELSAGAACFWLAAVEPVEPLELELAAADCEPVAALASEPDGLAAADAEPPAAAEEEPGAGARSFPNSVAASPLVAPDAGAPLTGPPAFGT